MKLQNKLIIFVLPLIVFPLVVLGGLAYNQLKHSTNERTLRSVDVLLDQVEINVKNKVDNVMATVRLFSYSPLLQDYLLTDDESARYSLMQPSLLRLFSAYQQAYPDHYEIQLLLPDGYEDTRSTIGYIRNATDLEGSSEIFKYLKEMEGAAVARFMINPDNGEDVLMVGQKVMVRDHGEDPSLVVPEMKAYLVVKVRLDFMHEMLDQAVAPIAGTISFVDSNERVLFSDTRAYVDDELKSFLHTDALYPSNVHKETTDEGELIIGKRIAPNLQLVGVLKDEYLSAGSQQLKNMVVAVLIVTIILTSLLIGVVLRRFFLRPINELNEVVNNFAEGRLEEKVDIYSDDEIGELYSTFEFMRQNLNRYRRKLEDSNRELSYAKRHAEEANQAKSAFLANMSHEIRTPLTAIIGFSESMQDGKQTAEERNEATRTIIRSGKHLHNIINEILDLSKIEANMLDVEVLNISLFEVMEDVKALSGLIASEKGLEFEVCYHAPIPSQIQTDPVRLKQILINLCNNATKFTKKGRVSVDITYDSNENRMSFTVTDTGIGLSTAQMETIFEAFTQADASITREFGGTGLGLSLSQRLAAILGGEITVESERGKGSQFTLTISAGDTRGFELMNDLPQLDTSAHDAPRPESLALSGRVLLVEDNDDNQRLVSLHVKRVGVDVDVANNGHQAVMMCMSSVQYDLVLMDMQMPVMGGLEATSTLRNMGADVPIVMLTANATKQDMDAAREAGCNEFLTKPINWPLFYESLEKYLPKKLGPISSTLIDDEPEMTDLINTYVSRMPDQMASLSQLIDEGDMEQLYRKVHDLKGSSGNYGFPELYEAANALEKLVEQGDLSGASQQMGVLAILVERIQQGVRFLEYEI
ncbi:ATP-binding protein [Pseudomonadota bacterium]